MRPDWNGASVYAMLRQARDLHPGTDLVTIGAVAYLVAGDRTQRTPAAIAHHPALAGGPLTSTGTNDPDRPTLHPDLSGPEQLCLHGIDVRKLTSDGRPRCADCRGVSRIMRNGSDEPSRADTHPPVPSRPRATERIEPGDPEPWQAIAARAFGLTGEHRGAGPMTWGGRWCWRHEDRPIVLPYDECEACLAERFDANDWREAHGRPIQLPVRATVAPADEPDLSQ